MRVVGGASKGRRLSSFAGLSIRPTSDKVRQAIFNILCPADEFSGRFKKVLDLFAGTGALGIEALSRGAERAVFVDKDIQSIRVIKKNLVACGVEERAVVMSKNAVSAVTALSRSGEKFDLIFIDPPYDAELTLSALSSIEKGGLLSPAGVLVAETSKRSPITTEFAGQKPSDERRYGDTLVYFFTQARADV